MDSISKDILFNVLYLKVGDSIGTGFCINYKEKRYLVTAKHLVEGMDKNAIDVGILRNGIYEHQIVKAFFHENENVDIVVLQAT